MEENKARQADDIIMANGSSGKRCKSLFKCKKNKFQDEHQYKGKKMIEKKNRTNHFEISDGDTLLVACRACQLKASDVESTVLLNNNNPLCVNGNVQCSSFYKMWQDSSENKTWIQCSMLSEYNDDIGSPTPLDVTEVDELCPNCNAMLVPSMNTDEYPYEWQCLECDEDFMGIEIVDTNKKKK